jgi:DNA invertase Pin-like site-specific DNA recombinase
VTHPLITMDHLNRKAIIYVRQSTEDNAISRATCETQIQLTRAYGWPEHLIEVIDDDIGEGGFSTDYRTGWQRMLAEIAHNSVGIIFTTSISRLSRDLLAYEQLRILAAYHGTLLCIGNQIIDPSDWPWRDNQ